MHKVTVVTLSVTLQDPSVAGHVLTTLNLTMQRIFRDETLGDKSASTSIHMLDEEDEEDIKGA